MRHAGLRWGRNHESTSHELMSYEGRVVRGGVWHPLRAVSFRRRCTFRRRTRSRRRCRQRCCRRWHGRARPKLSPGEAMPGEPHRSTFGPGVRIRVVRSGVLVYAPVVREVFAAEDVECAAERRASQPACNDDLFVPCRAAHLSRGPGQRRCSLPPSGNATGRNRGPCGKRHGSGSPEGKELASRKGHGSALGGSNLELALSARQAYSAAHHMFCTACIERVSGRTRRQPSCP